MNRIFKHSVLSAAAFAMVAASAPLSANAQETETFEPAPIAEPAAPVVEPEAPTVEPTAEPSNEPNAEATQDAAKKPRKVKVLAETAGVKLAHHRTNTWGLAKGAPNAEVWTEVMLPGGWSRSQQRKSDANGEFVIPLTYGHNSAGEWTYRVGTKAVDGKTVYSEEFELDRVPAPTAASAGSKPVGHETFTWGSFPVGRAKVWTEVYTGGKWSRSQIRTTNHRGGFQIPLTYGSNSRGTYRWRVAGQHPDLGVIRSREFTLKRTSNLTQQCAHAASAERGLKPQTVTVLRELCNTYPDVRRWLGVRRDSNSYHGQGRAIDVMVSGARGWEIARYAQANAARLGVIEVIYERKIWTSQRAKDGWRTMRDRGNRSANHYDHVHISVR